MEVEAERAKQYLIWRARIFWVVLKAITLKVLHLVLFVIRAYFFKELLCYGIAELREPTVFIPVVEERAA